MSGSATFTIVESSTTMNWPRQTTASAIQGASRDDRGGGAAVRHRSSLYKDHLHLYDDPLMLLRSSAAMGTVHAPGAMVLLTRLAKVVYRRSDEDRSACACAGTSRCRSSTTTTAPRSRRSARRSASTPTTSCCCSTSWRRPSYAERRRDPLDRRRHLVHITAAGRRALDRAERAQEGVEDEVLAALDADERATLRELLARALGTGLGGARACRGRPPLRRARPSAAAGTCCVMQCTPPPPSASTRPGTPTTSRPGSSAPSRRSASASMSGSCSPSGTIAAPLQR